MVQSTQRLQSSALYATKWQAAKQMALRGQLLEHGCFTDPRIHRSCTRHAGLLNSQSLQSHLDAIVSICSTHTLRLKPCPRRRRIVST